MAAAKFSIDLILRTGRVPGKTNLVKQQLRSVENAAHRVNQALGLMRTALVAIFATFGARELRRYTDAWIEVGNRLRLVTRSSSELLGVQGRLFQLAQDTRTDFHQTSIVYGRLALASKTLGRSSRELLRVQETLNKAVLVGGSNAREAWAGLIQLSQGIASNKLHGDELRSVLENLLGVSEALAIGLTKMWNRPVTRGEIRKLAIEGKLTADILTQAFIESAEEIDQMFLKIRPTIEQSFIVLKNAIGKAINEINNQFNISDKIVSLILKIAENTDTVAKALSGLGTAMAVVFGAKTVSMIINVGAALTAAFITNPVGATITAIGTALVGVSAALGYFGNETVKIGDKTVRVWDVVFAFLEEGWMFIRDGFTLAWTIISAAVDQSIRNIKSYFSGLLGHVKDFINTIIRWFVILAASMIKLIGAALSSIKDSLIGTSRVFLSIFSDPGKLFDPGSLAAEFGTAIKDAVVSNFKTAFEEASGFADTVLSADFVGEFLKTAGDFGTEIFKFTTGLAFGVQVTPEQFAAGVVDTVTSWVDTYRDVWNRIVNKASGRYKRPEAGDLSSLDDKDDSLSIFDQDEEKQLAKLLDQLNPVGAAIREFKERKQLLNRALDFGKLTLQEYLVNLDALKEKYKDQIDPIGAFRRELEQEKHAYSLSEFDRVEFLATKEAENKLREAGANLIEGETQLLIKQYSEYQRQKAIIEEAGNLINTYASDTFQLARGYEQLIALRPDLVDMVGETEAMNILNEAWRDLLDQFQRSPVRSYLEDMMDVSVNAEEALVGAFRGIEDAIADLVSSGEVNFKRLADAVIGEITRIIVRLYVMRYIMQAMGYSTTLATLPSGGAGAAIGAAAGGFAQGGLVTGPGGPTEDKIFALLSNGEYVVNAKATKMFGPLLDVLNSSVKSNSRSFLTDRVPSMISNGEYIINRGSAQRFEPLLHYINSFRDGGLVSNSNSGTPISYSARPPKGGDIKVSIDYNVTIEGGLSDNPAENERVLREMEAQIKRLKEGIKDVVKDELIKQSQPGGLINTISGGSL